MTTAVLVMTYGTPMDQDDIATFYTDIRRGHPPSQGELAALTARYEAIGGLSPLAERSDAQARALGAALESGAPREFSVFSATKHGRPRIEDVVADIASRGIERIVGLVLAPHYSAMSIGEYVARTEDAARIHDIASTFIENWHDMEALIDLLCERVQGAFSAIASEPATTTVVFSAHSLPARVLGTGDPYVGQLTRTADLVAARLGHDRYRIGWQSAPRVTREPWLGPDIVDIVAEETARGSSGMVVCPAGFTSDHLEVLYDLDIVAKDAAEQSGIAFVRTASLNDDPRLARGLSELVIDQAQRAFA